MIRVGMGVEDSAQTPVLFVQNLAYLSPRVFIAARVNSTGNIYKEDIDFLKEKVEEVWRLQKYILSNLH